MKVRIELQTDLEEEEVIIRCKSLTESVQQISRAIEELSAGAPRLTFTRGNEEFFLAPEQILFFQTSDEAVYAHTAHDIFRTKLCLRDLEGILPFSFLRVSKSAILNTRHVQSINRNLTAASLVQFRGSHKQLYVSRSYYKALRERMDYPENR